MGMSDQHSDGLNDVLFFHSAMMNRMMLDMIIC